jgi:chemotaxis protein methyltransferase CheR
VTERTDQACVEFLQWALPRLGLRWAGFRKVRRQVCRRIVRRIVELGLPDLRAYRDHLDSNPDEWASLSRLTPITISRFYRDRGVFAALETDVLPALAEAARESGRVSAWSAGCASGEEAYTLALVWQEVLAAKFPGLDLDVLATDIDPAMLRRARHASYGASSLKELPDALRERGFDRDGERYVVRPQLRRHVRVRAHDLRADPPSGRFDVVLCRNSAFTYFAPDCQREVLARLTSALAPGGALVIGVHERLPEPVLEPWPGVRAVFRAPAQRSCRGLRCPAAEPVLDTSAN